MLNYDAAMSIAVATFNHDGGTFDRLTGEPVTPTSGFAVAVPGGIHRFARIPEHTAMDVLSIDAPDSVPYIGTWRDNDGQVYVDPVVILPDRESALILGRAFGELAVWDFSTGTEVRLAD